MKVRRITTINLCLSCFLWLHALLILVFNLLLLGDLWEFSGYLFIIWIVIPLVSAFNALIESSIMEDADVRKKYVKRNGVILVIDVIVTLFTLFVSAKWAFWLY